MSTFFKTVFQPIANRHYTNKKTSLIAYCMNYVLLVAGLVYASLFVNHAAFLLLGALVVYAVVDYVLFDAALDKLTWKFFWSHFYPENSYVRSADHAAIKTFEKNPTTANKEALERLLSTDKSS